jgi:predicted component of type VI protein secretion system
MSVKLKVLHGAIKKHGKWQLTVPVTKSPFVIGQAADCNMRCFGQSIRDYHCEICIDGYDVLLCNLQPQSETFVNGSRLKGMQRFLAGDQLQLGRLAFELLVTLPKRDPTATDFDDLVSDMLLEQDEVDRRRRAGSPEQRWYQIESVAAKDPYEGLTPKERLIAKARKKLPPKQDKPKKLPKRRLIATDTTQAVTQGLAMYFDGIDVGAAGWNVVEE